MKEYVPYSKDPYRGPDRASFLLDGHVWRITNYTVAENLQNSVASCHYTIQRYGITPVTRDDYARAEFVEERKGFFEYNFEEPDYLRWSNPASLELNIMRSVLGSDELVPVDYNKTNREFGRYMDREGMNVVGVEHAYSIDDESCLVIIETGYWLRGKDEEDLYPKRLFNDLGKPITGIKFRPATSKDMQGDYVKAIDDLREGVVP